MASMIEEFHKQHDPSGQVVVDSGWVYWPDGARRENNRLGTLIEPSADPYRQAQYVLQYWELWTARKVDQFNELRSNLRAHAKGVESNGFGIPPTPDQLDRLREFKAEVDAAKVKLAEAQADVEAKIDPRIKQRKAEADARSAAAGEFLKELESIEI